MVNGSNINTIIMDMYCFSNSKPVLTFLGHLHRGEEEKCHASPVTFFGIDEILVSCILVNKLLLNIRSSSGELDFQYQL